MRASVKVGVVLAGYVGAALVALGTVAIYAWFGSGPERAASSGMAAFGDSLLFLAVFGMAAVPATGAGLFFLRPCRSFWKVLSGAGLALAATGLGACVVYLAALLGGPGSAFESWSAVAILRILIVPLFAPALALAGFLAPSRGPRIALLAAAVMETASFGCVALRWLATWR